MMAQYPQLQTKRATCDIDIIRELAKQYVDVCERPVQEERRRLWRQHNSLINTAPLIYVRAFAWKEMPQSQCVCQDSFFRHYESLLRRHLFWSTLGDDAVFEPWVTVRATHRCTGWGLSGDRHYSGAPGGSFKVDYPIKDYSDIERLQVPRHEIDEHQTAEHVSRLSDAIGDIITVNADRGPVYRGPVADLATDLGYLRGIEHFMMDMMDQPEALHRLVRFMSDGVLKAQQEAEDAGDWGLCAHDNQAMPYAEELPDPAANTNGISRSQLWTRMAAQEFTGVSPAMHEEFMLRYQLPIIQHFGLITYGCCEDLTHKIDMLRPIPNLRRIAVAPVADVARCAEQIGRDYVLSYRPDPGTMVGRDFDTDRIRSVLEADLKACRDCHVDITLKDVETVEGDPERVKNWVSLTREVIGDLYG